MGGILGFVFPVAGIVIGAAGGAAVGALVGNGVDRKFVEDVQNSLAPAARRSFSSSAAETPPPAAAARSNPTKAR